MRRPICDGHDLGSQGAGPFYVAALQTNTLVRFFTRHSERICSGLLGQALVAAQTALVSLGQAIKLIVIHARHIRGVVAGRAVAHTCCGYRGLSH